MAFYVSIEKEDDSNEPASPELVVKRTYPPRLEVEGHRNPQAALSDIQDMVRRTNGLRMETVSFANHLTIRYQPSCNMTQDKTLRLVEEIIDDTHFTQS